MKKKIIAMVLSTIFLTELSTVAVLIYMQKQAMVESFEEQQKTLLAFAADSVEIGLSDDLINFTKKTIDRISNYSVFAGAILYDNDMTPIMVKPEGYELSEEIKAKLKKSEEVKAGDIHYAVKIIKDSDNEVIGRLLIAFSQAPQKAKINQALYYSIVIGLFISLGAIMVITLLVTRIVKPLEQIIHVLDPEADIDLTFRLKINAKDEIGNLVLWLNRFIEKLHGLIVQVKESSETVASGSSQIAAGNQNLSQRSQEQASSIEETAATVEQMSSNIKANAENAQKANQLSRKASDDAVQGGKVVNKTIEQMKAVSESSKKIADIINVVNEIAFQTNLLALNAAVEAARAGEQGRGFAIVAGEVRNLAGRSAEAAKEIQSLIKDSVEKVAIGNKLVEETGNTLKNIISSIEDVAQTVSEISAASQEQSSGIDQVNKSIAVMDEVVQQNASLVEEAAATSENLSGEASDLQKLTASFIINNNNSGRQNNNDNLRQPIEKKENNANIPTPLPLDDDSFF